MAAVDDNVPATDCEPIGNRADMLPACGLVAAIILPAAPGFCRALSPVAANRHLTVRQDLDLALPHKALSGGQRAGASLMPTPLGRPEVLLPDAPISRHDKKLRQKFSNFAIAELKRMNIPTLMVTHDRADVPHDGKAVNLKKYMVSHV